MSASGWPERPLLLGLYQVVVLGTDQVKICNGGRSVGLSGAGVAERVTPVLDAFDGRHGADELEARFGGVVAELLESLVPKGLVVDGARTVDGPRSAPGLAALALGGDPWPAAVASKLAEALVVVAGCGPVGTAAAVQLGKGGVGRLRLLDGATASGRDVAVSPVLSPAAEGRPRCSAARDLVEAGTAATVEVAPDPLLAETLVGADLAVLETVYTDGDRPPADDEATACLAAGVAHVMHGQDALEGVVGPVIRPGGAPCHQCMDTRRLAHVAQLDEQLGYRRRRAQAGPMPDAFLAAHASVLAGILATTALRAMLRPDPVADRQAVVVDLLSMSTHREVVLPVPECPTCGTGGVGMG